MKDNVGMVILTIILVIFILIFPIYNLFERQDNMTYTVALKATTNFIDKVKEQGYIDLETYDELVFELANTGLPYDIELEVHRKELIIDGQDNGADRYVEQFKVDYNEDVFAVLDGTNTVSTVNEEVIEILGKNVYLLNKEDEVYVKLKNAIPTSAAIVFQAIAPTATEDRIVVNYGGVIENETWKQIDSTVHGYEQPSTAPTVQLFDYKNTELDLETTPSVEEGARYTIRATSTLTDWFKEAIIEFVCVVTYADNTKETFRTTNITKVGENFQGNITVDFDYKDAITIADIQVIAIDDYETSSDAYKASVNVFKVSPSAPVISVTGYPDFKENGFIVPLGIVTNIEFNAKSELRILYPYKRIAKYVWEIRDADTNALVESGTSNVNSTSEAGKYIFGLAEGDYVVSVYAEDTMGYRSAVTRQEFQVSFTFAEKVTNQSITSVGLAQVESMGFNGIYIVEYDLEVVIRDGHSGSDWWAVIGVTHSGQQFTIRRGNTTNGANVSGTLTKAQNVKYIIFQYSVDDGHAHCLTGGNAYMAYSVKYGS